MTRQAGQNRNVSREVNPMTTKSDRNGGRLLVVGDVHGYLQALQGVLQKACYRAGQDRLVLLGDYVDHGPASRDVIALVRELVKGGAVALKGNHEWMLYYSVYYGDKDDVYLWQQHGAAATLASYGIEAEGETIPVTPELKSDADFLAALPSCHAERGYLFAHAGALPGVPPDLQKDLDLLFWGGLKQLMAYKGPPTLVIGHLPVQAIRPRSSQPIIDGDLILMDTGKGYGGNLSLLELPALRLWQA